MATAVVLFTRDLRVRDNPALAAAAEADRVVPLFVLDDAVLSSSFAAPNRLGFLLESLTDLDGSLRRAGAGLVLRRGNTVEVALQVAEAAQATTLHIASDVSSFARSRLDGLNAAARRARIDIQTHDSLFVVPPAAVRPSGGEAYQVFTPYWRAWSAAPRHPSLPAPRRLTPADVRGDPVPALGDLTRRPRSADVAPGGETAALRRFRRWLDRSGDSYDADRDRPAADTSHVSAALHFGCLSPRQVVQDAAVAGATALVRQVCWRDFFSQVHAVHPDLTTRELRPGRDHWSRAPDLLATWRQGMTGFPLVDAGMRQLAATGWMHNRARLVAASFLTKHLGVDWRLGAAHFLDLLVDGDVAVNTGNWQWVAGCGLDTRPNRMFNPSVQARRYDPEGAYVRTWLPELGTPDYPQPVVGHEDAVAAFRARRGLPSP